MHGGSGGGGVKKARIEIIPLIDIIFFLLQRGGKSGAEAALSPPHLARLRAVRAPWKDSRKIGHSASQAPDRSLEAGV